MVESVIPKIPGSFGLVWVTVDGDKNDTFIVYNNNDVIVDTIDYVYIICIIVDVIHSNRNHKLRMNSSSNYKFLNQNKIIRLIVRYTC